MAKVTVQTDLSLLLRAMKNWQPNDTPTFLNPIGNTLTFNELCASALLHGAILTSRSGTSFVTLAARRLKVGRPTIVRWSLGEFAPHELGRAPAIAELRALLIELRDQNKASAT